MPPTTAKAPPSLDLLDMLDVFTDTLEISPGKSWTLRPLKLIEITALLQHNAPLLMAMYAMATKLVTTPSAQSLEFGPMITAFPEVIAQIIAMSTEQGEVEGAVQKIQDKMPITLQLIAIEKIWKLSVPEPKKLLDLLSVVMGQWQKALERAKIAGNAPLIDSPPTSAPPSTSSSEEVTT